MSLVENLLLDTDYYVQKAVGWVLHECSAIYPAQTLDFLTKQANKISAIAFTTAIKKLSIQE